VADPFPEVAGRGLEALRQAGLEVRVGVLEEEARRLNAAFFKRQRTGLPLVIAKWAMTLDGRLATASGDSRWISGQESRRRVHEVRRIADAVLVGIGTALRDEPSLTVRHVEPLAERGQPTRVVLDKGLSADAARQPFRTAREAPVLVYTTPETLAARPDRAEALTRAGCGVRTVSATPGGVDLRAVLEDLGRRGMSRVLVEGGAKVFGSLFAAGLVDHVMVFVAPLVLGGTGALGPVAGSDAQTMAEALRLKEVTTETVGPDTLIQGRAGDY